MANTTMANKQFQTKRLNRKIVIKFNGRPRSTTKNRGGKSKSKKNTSNEGDDDDGNERGRQFFGSVNHIPTNSRNLFALTNN